MLVSGQAVDPAGQPVVNATIQAQLFSGLIRAVGYDTVNGTEIIGLTSVATDANGNWLLDLRPNDTVDPANTLYRISYVKGGWGTGFDWISVPSTGGPFNVREVRVAAPDPTQQPGGPPVGDFVTQDDFNVFLDQNNGMLASLQQAIDGIDTSISASPDFALPAGMSITDLQDGVGPLNYKGGKFTFEPRNVFLDNALDAAWSGRPVPPTPMGFQELPFLPSAQAGQAGYSATVHVVGGTAPYQITDPSGGLPTGLGLVDNGDGTATIQGNVDPAATSANVVLQVVDAFEVTFQQNFRISVGPAGSFSSKIPNPLPLHGTVGQHYALDLTQWLVGFTGALTVPSSSGFDDDLLITVDVGRNKVSIVDNGTAPTAAQVLLLQLAIHDAGTGTTVNIITTLTIDSATPPTGPTIVTSSPWATGVQNAPYSQLLADDGQGDTPHIWSIPIGSLTAGWALRDRATYIPGIAGTHATDTLTKAGHGLAVWDAVYIGSTLLGGLVAGAVYYVCTVVDADHFKLTAALGGGAITFSGTSDDANMTVLALPAVRGVATATTTGNTVIVQVADNNGNSDQKSFTYAVNAPAAGFQWPLSPTLGVGHGTQNSDFGPVDTLAVASGATGTVTVDSYDETLKLSGVTVDTSANVLKKTGITAPAAGTVVSLSGLTGSGAVANGAINQYKVLNPGTTGGLPSFQLQALAGGAALSLAGLGGTPDVHRPTLPLKKVRLDPDGSVTGHAGRIYSTAGDPPTQVFSVNVVLRATDSGTGTTVTVTGVVIAVDAVGATLAIDSYINTFGASTDKSVGAANVVGLNRALAAAKIAVATLVCNHTGATQASPVRVCIGWGASVTPGGYLLQTGGNSPSSTTTGHHLYNLLNVELFLQDKQNMFPELRSGSYGNNPVGYGPPGLMFLGHAVDHPKLRILFNGNAMNQWQTDVTRAGGTTTQNRWGFYNNCLYLYGSPGTTADTNFLYRNGRGVAGVPGVHNLPNGDPAWSDEAYPVNFHGSKGGNKGYFDVRHQVNGDTCTDHASGIDFQYVQNAATSLESQVLVTMINCRHGVSQYAGGKLQILPGSYFQGCEHTIQCEHGTQSGAWPGTEMTISLRVGDPSGVYPQVTTVNNTYGGTPTAIQSNGNGYGAWDAPQGPTIKVYGLKSTGDQYLMRIDGKPARSIEFHDTHCFNPVANLMVITYSNGPTGVALTAAQKATQLGLKMSNMFVTNSDVSGLGARQMISNGTSPHDDAWVPANGQFAKLS